MPIGSILYAVNDVGFLTVAPLRPNVNLARPIEITNILDPPFRADKGVVPLGVRSKETLGQRRLDTIFQLHHNHIVKPAERDTRAVLQEIWRYPLQWQIQDRQELHPPYIRFPAEAPALLQAAHL